MMYYYTEKRFSTIVLLIIAVLRGMKSETYITLQQNSSIIQTSNTMQVIYNVSELVCFYSCNAKKNCSASSYDKSSMECILDKSGQWKQSTTDGILMQKYKEDISRKDAIIPGRPTDCSEIPVGSYSGRYRIYPGTLLDGIDVYCDMATDGGNWTVFQKRQDGSTDFYLKWDAYKIGFGNVNNEFWIGNDNLHVLTSQGNYQLRIDLWDWNEITTHAIYSTFKVGAGNTLYKLTIGGYSGDAGDSLAYHNNMKFSTSDRDNDGNSNWHCALQNNKGGFWYNNCQTVNLNGRYKPYPIYGNSVGGGSVTSWNTFRGATYSLKRCVMMMRKL